MKKRTVEMSGLPGNTGAACDPYIGPRPFRRADAPYFKGRDKETAILEGLVLSKRVVLFFAQSGAGKSSLIEAGLIPHLTEERPIGRGPRARTYQKMQVLPVLSVGGSFPPGELLPEMNLYVYLALSALEQKAKRAEIEALGNLRAGLAAYFAQNGMAEQDEELAGDILLIFDQFEELFTQHGERWLDRAGFFEQVIEALDAFPRLHILFAMREDFIAELVPFRSMFADNLRTRYRLERLDEQNALHAVVDPAEKCGRRYAANVAERLVKNLGRIQFGEKQGAEETLRKATMPLLIEPVHLQIVCQQLWENLEPGQTFIGENDVQKFGDVDEALADFYNRNIKKVVRETAVAERNLRGWFEKDLITGNRTRDFFYHDDIDSARISEGAVEQLSQAYIIRRIERSVDVWYELAHDRMVEPILAANEAWNTKYLQENPLANAYAASLNDPTFLLRGEPLANAQWYAARHPEENLPEEEEFLETSIAAEKARTRRRNWMIAIIAAIFAFGIAMGAMAFYANQQRINAERSRAEAEEQRNIAEAQRGIAENQRDIADEQREIAEENERLARSRELAAAALNNLDTDPELGILLALQALETKYTPEAENALRQVLQASRIERRFTVEGQGFRDVAINSAGTRLAAVGTDGRIRIWDLADPGASDPLMILPQVVEEEAAKIIYAVAFNPLNDAELATAHQDGSLKIWDIEKGQLLKEVEKSDYPLISLAYTADGSDQIAAIPNESHSCCNWEGKPFKHPEVYCVAISPDGRWLASAGKANTRTDEENGMVKIWDLQADSRESLGLLPYEKLDDHTDSVWAVTFSPDGRLLASGGEDKKVIVYDITGLAENEHPLILDIHYEHTDSISDLRFSANSRCLISGSLDRTAKVWDVETGELLHNLTGHTGQVQGVALIGTPAKEEEVPPTEICGPQVVTVGDDGTVRLWDLGPSAEELTLTEHTEPVESVDFSSSGEQVVTAGDDGRVIVWETASGEQSDELIDAGLGLDRAHADRVNRAIFSPDDALIATAGWDKVVKLWDGVTGASTSLAGHTGRIESIDFNEDGTLLATASDDGTARIWSVPDGRCLKSFVHNSTGINTDIRKVYGVRFHPQDEYLVTTGGDGWVRGWRLTEEMLAGSGSCEDPEQQAVEAEINFAPDASCRANPASCTVHDAVFNDEGTRQDTVDWNAEVILREFPAGTILADFTGHTKRLFGVQFEPHEDELATSGEDGRVRIWDLETGKTKQILPGPEFNYLDFSDDGDLLAVAGEDGTARIYALDLNELVRLARERLTRDKLTAEECERYELQDTAVCE